MNSEEEIEAIEAIEAEIIEWIARAYIRDWSARDRMLTRAQVEAIEDAVLDGESPVPVRQLAQAAEYRARVRATGNQRPKRNRQRDAVIRALVKMERKTSLTPARVREIVADAAGITLSRLSKIVNAKPPYR